MNIFLKPVAESDSQYIVKWRNNDKVRERCFSKSLIDINQQIEFYKNKVLTGLYKQYIVQCADPICGAAVYPIGVVYLKDLDIENKRCELCVFNNYDADWTSEEQSKAVRMLVEKAFEEFGMHKVYSYAFCKFTDEIRILKEAGFTEEVVLHNEVLENDGTTLDVVRMCVIK